MDYEEVGDKVRVHTHDGTTYEGTILVGADGINSTIRGLMKQKAEEKEPASGVKLETTDNGMRVRTGLPPILIRHRENRFSNRVQVPICHLAH